MTSGSLTPIRALLVANPAIAACLPPGTRGFQSYSVGPRKEEPISRLQSQSSIYTQQGGATEPHGHDEADGSQAHCCGVTPSPLMRANSALKHCWLDAHIMPAGARSV